MLGARVIDCRKLRTGRVIKDGALSVEVRWHNGTVGRVHIALLEFQPGCESKKLKSY